ncbi:hypothetical protein M9H77_37006 [Catharanthus roseus]|uniref:Uncharacterized protein n=1 Tax=Catharanthus roseus TaxID=4058 RepID=A0ACB9ZUR4_CATRO|nr:hypothetical protein M9H77_37006 [Catharanthus roseus]
MELNSRKYERRYPEIYYPDLRELLDMSSLEKHEYIERNYHAFIDAGARKCLCNGNVLPKHYCQTNPNIIVKGIGIDGQTLEFNLYAENISVQIGNYMVKIPLIYQLENCGGDILENNFMLLYGPFTVTNT